MLPNKKKKESKKTVKIHEYLVPDLSNDPTLNKRADESLAFIKKHGFPKELISKK